MEPTHCWGHHHRWVVCPAALRAVRCWGSGPETGNLTPVAPGG